MPDILIIDDDPTVNDLLATMVGGIGCRSRSVSGIGEALSTLKNERFDLVLLDVGLPDGNGLDLLPRLKAIQNPPEVVIITASCNPDDAEKAVRNGAWDYLVKPPALNEVIRTVRRALHYRAEKANRCTPVLLQRDAIVGSSMGLNAVLERIAQAAATESNVLITGETGTGKELFSQAIHANSSRRGKRFVVVDCAALPETLVESVLFGHAKGAFTGADKERDGLIRQAHGGTLFLDEVGELPLSIQKSFLRVVQERRVRPVGGRDEIQVDFRLIAATNRDLDALATASCFRSDLLFRLRTFSIEVPPLRRRPEDIGTLTARHINRLCDIYKIETKSLSSELGEALEQYPWPGNVRELMHTLEETLALAGSEPVLQPHHLPIRIRAILTRMKVGAQKPTAALPNRIATNPSGTETFLTINVYKEQMERHYLERLNQISQGSRKQACRISGLSRTRLFELLKKHQLDNPLYQTYSSTLGFGAVRFDEQNVFKSEQGPQ